MTKTRPEATWLAAQLEATPFLIIGHRGAAGLAPENSMESFRLAAVLGCPMIELDVRRVDARQRREQLRVIHDPTLDRTTDSRGKLATMSSTHLAAARLSNGESVPCLEDVLQWASASSPQIGVNIELKSANTGEVVADTVASCTAPVLVSSFRHDELASFRTQDSSSMVAPLYEQWQSDWHDVARALDATAVNLNARIVTAARIRAIHDAGLWVFAYTVNRRGHAQRLRNLGIDGVFTDRPDVLLDNDD